MAQMVLPVRFLEEFALRTFTPGRFSAFVGFTLLTSQLDSHLARSHLLNSKLISGIS
jgi:hypothetical protein